VGAFQFLGRNSGRSDLVGVFAIRNMGSFVSIPRSEFWSFGLADWREATEEEACFNSSVGILVVRTSASSIVCWMSSSRFNSSVGILVVRTCSARAVEVLAEVVSIPRSEFWSFGRHKVLACGRRWGKFQFLGRNSGRSDSPRSVRCRWCECCFNSSVGILVVRTQNRHRARGTTGAFQFLGRNSGRSDFTLVSFMEREYGSFNSSVGILVVRTQQAADFVRECLQVSIPRSEFWSFGQEEAQTQPEPKPGFNSSVGILVVRTFQALGRRDLRTGFNSSVGILVVRTRLAIFGAAGSGKFQFLGRNSGRSDLGRDDFQTLLDKVSIPRSEFWSFGQEAAELIGILPRTFQFLGRNSGRSDLCPGDLAARQQHCFNSSVGILVVRTLNSYPRPRRVFFLFQFLGRNSGRSDASFPSIQSAFKVVSIPRSEFWSFGHARPYEHG